MSRIPRSVLKSSFFHIIVQGINKEYIFSQDEYIKKYLYFMKQKLNASSVKLIAFCIMHNHAHILVYCDDISEISSLMRSINTAYALYYNKQNGRVGYVFRDRFISEPIYNEKYLLNCIAYIYNNPVKANIVNHPSKYQYSSYYDYTHCTGIVNDTILQLVFGSKTDYLSQFSLVHHSNTMQFKDHIVDSVDYHIIIQNHIDNFPYSLEQMIKNKDWKTLEHQLLFKNLIIDLKESSGLSFRGISQILKIDRRTLSKLLE